MMRFAALLVLVSADDYCDDDSTTLLQVQSHVKESKMQATRTNLVSDVGVKRGRGDQPSGTDHGYYHYGSIGSGTTCPTTEVSEDKCVEAVRALLPAGQVQRAASGMSTPWPGSWRHVPPGCSVGPRREPDNAWIAHFNENADGGNNGAFTKVCFHPNTQYHILGYGMPRCPEGKTIETEEECETAHNFLGLEIVPKWTGTAQHIPGLCSTRNLPNVDGCSVTAHGHESSNWFHFNSESVGSLNLEHSPLCRV